MSAESENYRKEYLESVKLYLWYQSSPFSFFQGKDSKVEAERYRYLSQYFWDAYLKEKKK